MLAPAGLCPRQQTHDTGERAEQGHRNADFVDKNKTHRCRNLPACGQDGTDDRLRDNCQSHHTDADVAVDSAADLPYPRSSWVIWMRLPQVSESWAIFDAVTSVGGMVNSALRAFMRS